MLTMPNNKTCQIRKLSFWQPGTFFSGYPASQKRPDLLFFRFTLSNLLSWIQSTLGDCGGPSFLLAQSLTGPASRRLAERGRRGEPSPRRHALSMSAIYPAIHFLYINFFSRKCIIEDLAKTKKHIQATYF